jgi:hypothetical protein
MSTATLTGVTWNKTTCPDNANSSTNGGTCLGHTRKMVLPLDGGRVFSAYFNLS